MKKQKDKLRQSLKQARSALSVADHTRMSRQICKRLQELTDWSAVKSVHYFEPITYLQEIDLGNFIVYLEDNYPDIQLFTPRKIGKEWEMISIKTGQPPKNFDVIIVPMLGFDAQLNRIGYGGGYYDKFLATQPKARKIGVCFEIGKLDKIPAEPHDIALDLVVTEGQVYHR